MGGLSSKKQQTTERETENQQQLSERKTEKQQQTQMPSKRRQATERETEKQQLPERETEKQQLSERKTEKQQLSERETEKQQLSERETEKQQLSERETEKQQLSERETEKQQLSERETEKQQKKQMPSKRRHATERETEKQQLSERETEKQQLSERETEKQQLSERESEKQQLSERETEKQQLSEQETEKQQLSERVTEKQQLSERETEKQQLSFIEIKEEQNITMEKRITFCDVCLYNDNASHFRWIYFGMGVVRALRKVEGVYICYECELTLCENCVKGHESHKLCVYKENEERERVREELINILMKEEGREDKLEEVNECMYDRVNVTHELDRVECGITGLCGLDNRRWVACDIRNSCIKIFQCGSNILQRYIRIGSKPRDVTEIQVKQNSTVPDSASSSKTDISVTDSTRPDKQCILAVTLPRERHILFIDVNKIPALNVKTIKMEKECFRIEFCDDKIFTLCKEDSSLNDHWSVYIMSTDGVQLSRIQTDPNRGYIPDLAVVPGRLFVTDRENDIVNCIDLHVPDEVFLEIKILKSGPTGISVDPDHNVYIVASDYNKICKLYSDLERKPRVLLIDQDTDYMEGPRALCFYRDKLFVSHQSLSSLANIVSVVMLV